MPLIRHLSIFRLTAKGKSTVPEKDSGFHSDSTDKIKSCKVTDDYDNSTPLNELKSPDNYIIFEPENTYTYIDHGDIKVMKAPANSENTDAKRAPSNLDGYRIRNYSFI